ncbi:trypsin-1-like [Dendroctonus ponderosae]|uniref:trypsin-1-like n=1 Tax=Dendroctonus ponderosae TaxID=77166 RepID=UPI0020354F60|nr:trypsin-1-like [Dendroctonus ponderosae]
MRKLSTASYGTSAGCMVGVLIDKREDLLEPEPLVPLPDGRIVGGWPVNITSHPYQASFHNWHRHSCGAVLIAPDWIVTAAHCVSAGPHRYSFRLGSHLWASGGTVLMATHLLRHAQYNATTIDYDIALVRLSMAQSAVEDIIGYAQLPPEGWHPTAGSLATVAGWGTPFAGGSLMDELQEVTVPIVNNESCQEFYSDLSNRTGIFITDRMVCAGFTEGGQDACSGDSGGPLMVDGYLTGIVSWGNGCARAGFPGVYASVPHFVPWIKEITGL